MKNESAIEVESNPIRRAWLTLCWTFGFHYRMYSESHTEASVTDAAMQYLVISLSRGRLTWGKTALVGRECLVCGQAYWTLSKPLICRRYKCYMAYHSNPKQFRKKERND